MSNVFERFFTEQEERRLWSAIRRIKGLYAKRDYCWIRILRLTGLRINPFAMLSVADAQRIVEKAVISIGEFNKRQKQQQIPASKEVAELFTQLLKLNKKVRCDDDALIPSRNGKRMTVRNYQKRFSFWLKEAGIERGSVHWLRHTFAKRFLAKNDTTNGLLVLQELLGHSDLKTTLIYTKPDKQMIVEMMNDAG